MSHMKQSRHLGMPKGLPIQLSPRQVHPQRMVTHQPVIHSKADPSMANVPMNEFTNKSSTNHQRTKTKSRGENHPHTQQKVKSSWSHAQMLTPKLLIQSIGTLTESNASYANFMNSNFGDLNDGFLLRIIREMCPSPCIPFFSASIRHFKYDILDLDGNLVLTGSVECPCCEACSQSVIVDSDEDEISQTITEIESSDHRPSYDYRNTKFLERQQEQQQRQQQRQQQQQQQKSERRPSDLDPSSSNSSSFHTLLLHNIKYDPPRPVVRLIMPARTGLCSGKTATRVESPPGIVVGWVNKKPILFSHSQYVIYDAAELVNMIVRRTSVAESKSPEHHPHHSHHQHHPHHAHHPRSPHHPHHPHHPRSPHPLSHTQTHTHAQNHPSSSSSSRKFNPNSADRSDTAGTTKKSYVDESVDNDSDSEVEDLVQSHALGCICPFTIEPRASMAIYEVQSVFSNVVKISELNQMSKQMKDQSPSKVTNLKTSESEAIAIKLLKAASLDGDIKEQLNGPATQLSVESTDQSINAPSPGPMHPAYKSQLLETFNSHHSNGQINNSTTTNSSQFNSSNLTTNSSQFNSSKLTTNSSPDRAALFFGSSHQDDSTSNTKFITCLFTKGTGYRQKLLILSSLLILAKDKELT